MEPGEEVRKRPKEPLLSRAECHYGLGSCLAWARIATVEIDAIWDCTFCASLALFSNADALSLMGAIGNLFRE